MAIDKRIKDAKYGIPLQIINLDWNPGKRNYHQSSTKGDWDDVFIRRKPQGGLEVEYRNPGALEWIKDGLSGEYSALCAVTEKNLFLLASHYYDGLWTIRDPFIEKQVKEKADEIDEANKKISYRFVKISKKINPETGMYETHEEIVNGTMYDFHVMRRTAHFEDHNEKLSVSPMGVNERSNIDMERAEIARKKKELEERERSIKEREKSAGISIDVIDKNRPVPEVTGEAPGYQQAELVNMHFSKLRKLGKDEFGITDAFKMKKNDLVSKIMNIQSDIDVSDDAFEGVKNITPRQSMVAEIESEMEEVAN